MAKPSQVHQRIILMVTSSISLPFLSGTARRLQQRGWQVGVIASPTTPGQLEEFAQAENVRALPVPMEREISVQRDATSLVQLLRVLRQFRPLLTNVNTPKAGLLGGLAGVAARVPLRVYTIHGLRLETTTGPRRLLLTLTEKLAMACAQRIVCVSPSLRKRIHELNLAPEHKTLVLGSGSVRGVDPPDHRACADLTASLRRQLWLPEGTPVIGFVGRLVKDKGIAELLQAYELLLETVPAAKLLLIGGEEQGDPLDDQVWTQLRRLKGVISTGAVPDVTPYYPLMTVLALPTYREGFPTVALEAAAAGLPVVTTMATGARDAVKHGETGWLVPVGDAQALFSALHQVLQDEEQAHRMGRAAQTWVYRDFAPHEVQQRWIAFYEELLAWHELSRRNLPKRTFDLVFSAAALTVLGLPMLALAVLVRLHLGGPVLFRQMRPGLGGQPFTMYKFRTMTDRRGPDGHLLPDAQRLTPLGRFLRSTSLDELPGLFNVLRGEMSLVGPRPLLMDYLRLYTPRQARRHEVRPGITGWAQVNGRNTLGWDEKFELDVWYVDHQSWRLDLRILWLTAIKVVRRDGISAPGEETMSPFQGSADT